MNARIRYSDTPWPHTPWQLPPGQHSLWTPFHIYVCTQTPGADLADDESRGGRRCGVWVDTHPHTGAACGCGVRVLDVIGGGVGAARQCGVGVGSRGFFTFRGFAGRLRGRELSTRGGCQRDGAGSFSACLCFVHAVLAWRCQRAGGECLCLGSLGGGAGCIAAVYEAGSELWRPAE